MSTFDLQSALSAYLECALWSSVHYTSEDSEGEPMDDVADIDDISDDLRTESSNDLAAFIESNSEDIADMAPEQVGHDFWLNRNGHGAGFWGRGLGERGERLSDAAKVYGTVDLWIGEDGKVYSN